MSKDVKAKAPDGFKSLDDLRACILALDMLRDAAAVGLGLKPSRPAREPRDR